MTRPLFAKASTAQEVVDAAKERVEARQRAEKEAEEKASELALPALSGTPRQIAWAMQIRAEHAQHHPDATNLKRATTAKYWIDNRDKLGEKKPRRLRI